MCVCVISVRHFMAQWLTFYSAVVNILACRRRRPRFDSDMNDGFCVFRAFFGPPGRRPRPTREHHWSELSRTPFSGPSPTREHQWSQLAHPHFFSARPGRRPEAAGCLSKGPQPWTSMVAVNYDTGKTKVCRQLPPTILSSVVV